MLSNYAGPAITTEDPLLQYEAITGDRTSEHCLTSHVGVGYPVRTAQCSLCNDAATFSAVTAAPKWSNCGTFRSSTVGSAETVDARILCEFT